MTKVTVDASAISEREEVAPDKIEAALGKRWRQQAEIAKGSGGRPITRAFLWNLIVSGPVETTRALVDELAAELPARAIVLARPIEGDGSLKTFVETNIAGSGAHAVGSDEITIEIGGSEAQAKAALARVPSLVRSVLVPDALTALMWIDAPAPESHVTRQFIGEIDRLILDSRRLAPSADGDGHGAELGLKQIVALAEEYPRLELADLSWLGISPLRGLAAALFDAPADPSPLQQLDQVVITSGVAGVQVRALLMFGWLGIRLGWQAPRQARSQNRGERRFVVNRLDGGEVLLRLTTDLTGVKHGVRRLELVAGERRWSLDRDEEKIEVRAPGVAPRMQPARSHGVAARLAEALGRKGRDPSYRDALGFAALLAGVQR